MKVLPNIFHFLLITLTALPTFSQHSQEKPEFPQIKIHISKEQLNQLRNVEGMKMEFRQPLLIVNNDTVPVKDIHSRGASSMNFARKSLSVEVEHSLTFPAQGETVKIKKFDLLNLVMDKNLWHNRWAFINLAELNLFPLYNTYCKLWINNQPQGIYLLVEKPNNFTTRIKGQYMIRRGLNHGIKHEYINTHSKAEARQYRERYYGIYKDLKKYNNQILCDRLRASLQLDHYFNWLAFNYLILNGDYSDEIYFYIRPDAETFDIIPWDYDDIFKREPHEGATTRNVILRNKLIFSLEDELDRSIASDSLLYAQYCAAFRKMLLTRDLEVIDRTFNQVLDQLELLANDPAMNKASGFLEKDSFSFEQAKVDVTATKTFLLERRMLLLKALVK